MTTVMATNISWQQVAFLKVCAFCLLLYIAVKEGNHILGKLLEMFLLCKIFYV